MEKGELWKDKRITENRDREMDCKGGRGKIVEAGNNRLGEKHKLSGIRKRCVAIYMKKLKCGKTKDNGKKRTER